jgi:type VI secretion system protein ImpL
MPPARPVDAQPATPLAATPASSRQPADADDLAAVLRAFERAHRALADTALPRTVAQVAELRRFDEQMERVRAFLAPLFPTEEGAVGGHDVQVEFRANQAAEIEGSAIIEWSLSVGPQTLRHRDSPRPLRWEPGMPVTLTLRLARDAPARPVADPAQPMLLVDDRTVSYRFQDPWALLGLIQRHREAEAGPRGDGRSQLLRFEFPLQISAELPGLAPSTSRARVYVRMVVSAPGKRTPLVWPGHFPSQAPVWNAP